MLRTIKKPVLICDSCGARFSEPGKKTERAEYPGGKSWTFEISPCCGDGFMEVVG